MRTATDLVKEFNRNCDCEPSQADLGWLERNIREFVSERMPNIPQHAICFFKDGDKMCAVFGDFIDLEQSPAGFGDTFVKAMEDLDRNKSSKFVYVRYEKCPECPGDGRQCHLCFGTGQVKRREVEEAKP